MDDKIFESIVEMTSKRDSDEFGISIIASIAELIPDCIVALFTCIEHPKAYFKELTTLSVHYDDKGDKECLWNIGLPDSIKKYIDENFEKLNELSVYKIDDDYFHTFFPITIDKKVEYGINISSKESITPQLNSLLAIIKVCQNFYAILASSEKDSLTGLYNRKTYDQKLSMLLRKQQNNQLNNLTWGQSSNSGTELRYTNNQSFTWLAIIDIDLFKKVNDKYGHLYGDEVLLLLSQLMQQSFRQNDLLFRFGGEEFVIIFEPIPEEKAHFVLNKFRQLVEKYDFPMVGKVTISIGYAKVTESDHPKSVFDNADKALYYSKENGRNCLHNYESLVEQSLVVNSIVEEGDIELF
ncbi:MAG: GGDEF domain-containing protein [Colwelliaceae bacterium]|nr:GGDEF domain-containing protein [Colwelliaceae bacterium]